RDTIPRGRLCPAPPMSFTSRLNLMISSEYFNVTAARATPASGFSGEEGGTPRPGSRIRTPLTNEMVHHLANPCRPAGTRGPHDFGVLHWLRPLAAVPSKNLI